MTQAPVLGGDGLIGAACMRALTQAGCRVSGMGQSARAAHASDPVAAWAIRDIPAITCAARRVATPF